MLVVVPCSWRERVDPYGEGRHDGDPETGLAGALFFTRWGWSAVLPALIRAIGGGHLLSSVACSGADRNFRAAAESKANGPSWPWPGTPRSRDRAALRSSWALSESAYEAEHSMFRRVRWAGSASAGSACLTGP